MEDLYVRYRRLFTGLFDVSAVALAVFLAFQLRFDFAVPAAEMAMMKRCIWIAVAVRLAVYQIAGTPRLSWRRVSSADFGLIVGSSVVGSIPLAAAAYFYIGTSFPRSVLLMELGILTLIKCGTRLTTRMAFEKGFRKNRFVVRIRKDRNQEKRAPRVLVYGTFDACEALLREIKQNDRLEYEVVGMLNDDPRSRDMSLMGLQVLGPGRRAPQIVDLFQKRSMPIDEIIIAMPSASGQEMREAVANCRAAGVRFRTIPSVAELLSGKVRTSQLRDVSVEDLLGRAPVRLNEDEVRAWLRGRVVMVTGGGGSIGSELCRQVARFDPGCLVILERSESDLFRIHHELMEANPRLKVVQAIADIREYERVLRIIKQNHVSVIFHAAAYKHVPLMEENIIEAVRNNVLGTYNVAKAAKAAGVTSFIQVSTDKAVNPTNIMGLTKRLTELIVSAFPIPSEGGSTKFVSVRFGNVLGSNGSVIPIFKQQIQAGGPVTVTHPEMRRYFMTIPEAAQLVLQAGMMSQGSEIFVLDMGEAVKIVDLARNMIRLSGHEPDQDIEIRFVGLRPGEKLHEEINLSAEDMMPTYHNKIRIFCGPRKHYAEMEACIRDLARYVSSEDESNILRVLMGMVPEYAPSGHWRLLLTNSKPQLKAISAAG